MTRARLAPGPRGLPLVGCAPQFFRGQTAFLARTARTFGDVASFRLGRERIVLINHPELIGEVLVTRQWSFKKGRGLERARVLLGDGLLTSEGEFHLRQRRLAQPAFHRKRIASYADTMVAHTVERVGRWREGLVVDVAQEMSALTMGIAGWTLFRHDVSGEASEVGHALTTFLELFWRAALPFSERLDRFPLPHVRRFRDARARLDRVISRMIEERRCEGADRGDLLSMLLLAQDEADGTGMTDTQLRDEVLTIFLAGHETTALAVTWTLYLLWLHPEVERRLRAEVDGALRGEPATAESLPALAYVRMVVAEAMRLFPPAWLLARRALEELELGGWLVPARAMVFMSQYVTHRDARLYPDPERFDPGRWTPEAEAARPKFAYFPFGGGSRQCIGESFAWMEAVLLVATIVQRWRLELVPGHPVALKPSVTLRPKHGMRMIVRRPE
jgi:cytochrome P450